MEQKIITVSKTVTEKLPADTVAVSIKAAGVAKNHADAFSEAEKTADAAISALKALGFDGIRMLGANVSERREDKKIIGYRAVRSFSLEFPYDGKRLCELSEALSKTPCEWRVSFALKDGSHKKELLERAVKQAREEAECIAKAAGAKIYSFFGAEYSSSDGDASPMLMRAAVFSDAAAPVEPELIELRESVTCKWDTADC